jgi:hypothetical protein
VRPLKVLCAVLTGELYPAANVAEVELVLVIGDATDAQQLSGSLKNFMPRVEDRAVDRVEIVVDEVLM